MTHVKASPGFVRRRAPLGWLGVAWTCRGVARIAVAEPDARACEAALRRGLAEAHAATPPAAIGALLEALAAELEGVPADHREVALDLGALSPFRVAVYAAARTVPRGRTATYGELAGRVGRPGGARAVGGALGANPFPLVVPCHRVLAAGGALGGFSMAGGVGTKRRLLALEGIEVAAP